MFLKKRLVRWSDDIVLAIAIGADALFFLCSEDRKNFMFGVAFASFLGLFGYFMARSDQQINEREEFLSFMILGVICLILAGGIAWHRGESSWVLVSVLTLSLLLATETYQIIRKHDFLWKTGILID